MAARVAGPTRAEPGRAGRLQRGGHGSPRRRAAAVLDLAAAADRAEHGRSRTRCRSAAPGLDSSPRPGPGRPRAVLAPGRPRAPRARRTRPAAPWPDTAADRSAERLDRGDDRRPATATRSRSSSRRRPGPAPAGGDYLGGQHGHGPRSSRGGRGRPAWAGPGSGPRSARDAGKRATLPERSAASEAAARRPTRRRLKARGDPQARVLRASRGSARKTRAARSRCGRRRGRPRTSARRRLLAGGVVVEAGCQAASTPSGPGLPGAPRGPGPGPAAPPGAASSSRSLGRERPVGVRLVGRAGRRRPRARR